MLSKVWVLAFGASAAAQAVTRLIVPSGVAPMGCDNSRDGTFQLTIVSANGSVAAPSGASGAVMTSGASSSSASSSAAGTGIGHHHRQIEALAGSSGNLQLSLTGGILTDSFGRTGYIASNYQFQFDKPPQAGAIYTGGWTICPNGSLALGSKAVFWSCVSGAFSNLYDRDWAPVHCAPVYLYSAAGLGSAYSTPPPQSPSTGGDQATIANAGGTQSQNNTASATGFGFSAATSSAPSTTSASSTAGKTSKGGAAGMDTDAPRTLLAWAMGAVGAIALV